MLATNYVPLISDNLAFTLLSVISSSYMARLYLHIVLEHRLIQNHITVSHPLPLFLLKCHGNNNTDAVKLGQTPYPVSPSAE